MSHGVMTTCFLSQLLVECCCRHISPEQEHLCKHTHARWYPLCRFLRHFTMLAVPPPSDAAIKTILTAILSGFLAAEFPADMKGVTGPVVNASVEVYNRWDSTAGCDGLADNLHVDMSV